MIKRTLIVLLIIHSYLPANDWEILNKGLPGALNTIDFVDDQTGWISGYQSVLVKTENGGATWIPIQLSENWNFYGIDFINQTTGWAIAWDMEHSANIIVKTEDGGLSWNIQHSDEDCHFSALFAIHEQLIFVVGYNGIILKTDNGGADWENISPYADQTYFTSVWFMSENVGLVTGSCYDGEKYQVIVAKTVNGGKKWHERIFDGYNQINNVQFYNDSTAFFQARDDSGQDLFCMTKDTLSSWLVQSKSDSFINSFYALSEDTVYAIMNNFSVGSTEADLKISTNGGRKWQIIKSLGSSFYNAISFNNNAGFIAGSTAGFGTLTGCLLSRSLDKGFSWEAQILSYPFSDCSFINKDYGFICGGVADIHTNAGDVYLTNDGGKNLEHNFNPQACVNECQFLNDQTGYILCDGMFSGSNVYKTSDGGDRWQIIMDQGSFPSGHFFTGNDLYFVNENIGYLCGGYWDGEDNKAVILETENGGAKWDMTWQKTGENYSIYSIHFSDINHGFAVGSNGLIVKYEHVTGWKETKSITDKNLKKVFFADHSTGWISGGNHVPGVSDLILMTTKNGGESWDIQTNFEYILEDIYFKDIYKGWAVGSDTSWRGMILYTENGGQSWEIKEEKLPAPLYSICFKDGFVWTVGGLGMILRTKDDASAIDDDKNISKMIFRLDQNYPNPFNHTTTIKYRLPVAGNVEISVYNMLGQKITTLVSQKQSPGNYKVKWEANGFPSGVYIYSLRLENRPVETKKMLYLK